MMIKNAEDNNMMNENKENMKKLSKKDLLKSFWIWELTSEMCLSYERLMSLGFCHAMVPIAQKLYGDNPDELKKALVRHMSFFNTENQFGAMIPGIVASIEEERANGTPYSDDMIDSLKVGLMGPLAGVGDTVTQGLVKTILLAIFVDMGLKGNVWAPLLFFVLYTAYILGMGGFMYSTGYKLGRNAFASIKDSNIIRKLTDCMSVLGMSVAGCMISSYVDIQTAIEFTNGDTVVVLQDVLNEIMPGLLSVVAVFTLYGLIKKNVSVLKIIAGIAVVGVVGALVGFF